MKKNLIILLLSIAALGCSSPEKLTNAKAKELIEKEYLPAKYLDKIIYTADPKTARELLEARLEESGLVTIKKTYTALEEGQPLITFTQKASTFLLPTAEKDKKYFAQTVKIADIVFESITGIQTSADGKSAVVTYTEIYKNITPFSILFKRDLKKKTEYTASFSLFDDGWRLDSNKRL